MWQGLGDAVIGLVVVVVNAVVAVGSAVMEFLEVVSGYNF